MTTFFIRWMLARAFVWLLPNFHRVLITVTLVSAFAAAINEKWVLALRICAVGGFAFWIVICAMWLCAEWRDMSAALIGTLWDDLRFRPWVFYA